MIDHKLCRTTVSWFPPWPCPACKQGTIQNGKESESPIRHWPDTGVAFAINEGYIERSDDYGVFSATLVCSNYQCQQGVAVIGDYSTSLIDAQTWETERKYVILDVHPEILLIDVPDPTPDLIKAAVTSSFALYWRDPEACAGRLRTAVERVVDHLLPSRQPSGKFVSLGRRLTALSPKHPELAEAADVLRYVGNEGAHGDTVERDRLLACYELFEIELRKLFADDELRRKALITKLRSPKASVPPKP
jgi:hypothetical protein